MISFFTCVDRECLSSMGMSSPQAHGAQQRRGGGYWTGAVTTSSSFRRTLGSRLSLSRDVSTESLASISHWSPPQPPPPRSSSARLGGLMVGLGQGVLGIVTRPVSGALDLVASTSQVCFDPQSPS